MISINSSFNEKLNIQSSVFFIFLILLFSKNFSHAYPEFIGYGYGSCLTCHYNGAGGGPLSDYGRSLFAVEIAAKPPFSKLKNDDLGKVANFLYSIETPGWFKPYAKFRQLYMETNAGTANKSGRNIIMQASLGLTSAFGPDEKFLLSGEVGYVPKPMGAKANDDLQNRQTISREYYFRHQVGESTWYYLGFLDKPFGLRIPDHSSFSRSGIGLGQNDQSHGVMFHHINDQFEYLNMIFVGNTLQDKDLRQAGLSGYVEYEPIEKKRWGFSYLLSQNKFVAQKKLGGHLKLGYGFGHAFLTEVGLSNQLGLLNKKNTTSIFGLFESQVRIRRGLLFIALGEYNKKDIQPLDPENVKWGMGFAYFPMQRMEFRTTLTQTRTLNTKNFQQDGLLWLGQLHLSL